MFFGDFGGVPGTFGSTTTFGIPNATVGTTPGFGGFPFGGFGGFPFGGFV